MSGHIRQHWIPRAYLGAWCDPDPARQNPRRVYHYGVDGRYRGWRPPSRIFTADDLYTVPQPDGGRDLKTEHALSRLEASFAEMRARYLLKGAPLPPSARRDLLWFIAALRSRSPAARDRHGAFWSGAVEVGEATKHGLDAMAPERRAEWLKKTRPTPLRGANEGGIPLGALREIAAQPFGAYLPGHIVIEAGLLEQMHLAVLRAPDGHALITSDRPVVWWDPEDPPPSRSPLGLGRPTIEITVPLAPFLCALISHRRGPDYADADAEGVDVLNMRTLNRASKEFIANRPDLAVAWRDGPGHG